MRHAAPTLLLLGLLVGCSSSPASIAHDAPSLTLLESDGVRLRTDLPPETAEELLESVRTLESAIDSAFPWLEQSSNPPLTLVLADSAHYALFASDHQVEGASGAFVCPAAEVVLRYRPEDWGELEGPPFPLEPRIRPLAAALLRRRLVQRYGKDLEQTWVEEGLVRVFVEIAAVEFGEIAHAKRQNRERLLDAFLPLYLGGKPALLPLTNARGLQHMKRAGSGAQAWAAVRFLLAEPDRLAFIDAALLDAGGGKPEGESWEQRHTKLSVLDAAFEEFLLNAVLHELLTAFLDAPTPVDRWEAAAALRLIANVDLDADAGDAQRALIVRGEFKVFEEHPVQPRFLDKYEQELVLVRGSRSRLQTMSRLMKVVRKELVRRSSGYGHPAVEHARRNMGKALQRALDGE